MIEVGFIIHKNGNTSAFEVLRCEPTCLWDVTAIEAAKQLQFTPKQAATSDIYTTWMFSFSDD